MGREGSSLGLARPQLPSEPHGGREGKAPKKSPHPQGRARESLQREAGAERSPGEARGVSTTSWQRAAGRAGPAPAVTAAGGPEPDLAPEGGAAGRPHGEASLRAHVCSAGPGVTAPRRLLAVQYLCAGDTVWVLNA